jgi:plasmid stabilization system protein ParE
MAIYHLSAKIASRAKGQSVVASAPYHAAENLYDRHIGQTFDYTRKQGVEHSEILAPEGAPEWVQDRERLWNKVERVERRKDSIIDGVEILAAHPFVGRACEANLRELVISYGKTGYIALYSYEVSHDAALILAIRHQLDSQ